MNEEEKKAIETLKNTSLDPLEYKGNMNAIEIILDLLEKQQKEIEELKDKQDYARLEKEQLLEDVNKYFIKKDKIKEKIKEYEELVNEFEEYWSKDPRRFKREKSIDYYKLEALKELLGE